LTDLNELAGRLFKMAETLRTNLRPSRYAQPVLALIKLAGLSVTWLAIPLVLHAQPKLAEITLPDVLAVELPLGAHDLRPNDPPLRDLLNSARSGTLKVTADLANPVSAGAVKVTWTAWDAAGKPAATRSAVICVLPTGMTPVGMSGDENATAGNNATHIARDPSGHVHMVWATGSGPQYRRATEADEGIVHLDTPPINIAEGAPAGWNNYPALAISGDAIQIIWQGGGTVRTRRLPLGGYTAGPVTDTGAKSDGRDVGPAIAADERGLHLVTPAGIYASSTDAGRTWRIDAIPLPPGQRIKTATLATAPNGAIDLAFSSIARDRASASEDAGSGGWWQLRTIRRTADGVWADPQDALVNLHEWAAPPPSEDALVDWVRTASDAQGGLHVVWHGTAASRVYGHDSAFYAWRDPAGIWHAPVSLIPRDPAHGVRYSFAPSLAVDGDRALAVVFYDVFVGTAWLGFDSAVAVLRQGRMQGPPLPLTHFNADAAAAGKPELGFSSRFPAAAPSVSRAPNGHIWLDVLETLHSRFPDAPGHLIVYHRADVTAALNR
jgi:hypothetical protein